MKLKTEPSCYSNAYPPLLSSSGLAAGSSPYPECRLHTSSTTSSSSFENTCHHQQSFPPTRKPSFSQASKPDIPDKPAANRFSVLDELPQSPPDTYCDSTSATTSARNQKRRGKRGGKRRRPRHSALGQTEDCEELCGKMATLSLNTDESQSLPKQFSDESHLDSKSESTIVSIESVRHHWAPQFLPNATSSTPVFDKAHLQQSVGTQSMIKLAALSQSGTEFKDMSNCIVSSQFHFPALLTSLAFADSAASPREFDSTEPPPKKRKLGNTAPTTFQLSPGRGKVAGATSSGALPDGFRPSLRVSRDAAKHKFMEISTLGLQPMPQIKHRSSFLRPTMSFVSSSYADTPITTTAPILPKFSFEELSPTCTSSLYPAALSVSSQLQLASASERSLTPLVPYPSLTKSPAQRWKELSKDASVLQDSNLAHTTASSTNPCSSVGRSQLWRRPTIPKVQNSALFSALCSSGRGASPPKLDSDGSLKDFFDMGHSNQCWCSKHTSEKPYLSNDIGDASLLSLPDMKANPTSAQPREQGLHPGGDSSRSHEPNSTSTPTETGTDVGADAEIDSQISDSEFEDWYGLDDITCQKVAYEDDWAFVSHAVKDREFQSHSPSDSASESSAHTYEASVSTSLPLTPTISLDSTIRTVSSDLNDGDTPNSWMMKAVCFSQSQDCAMCLRCECICISSSVGAVEWPSLQESLEVRQRGRTQRMW
jgi:hypothetical protein